MMRAILLTGFGCLAATSAHADVIEIGDGGASWVAGGPAARAATSKNPLQLAPSDRTGSEPAPTMAPVSSGVDSRAMTRVASDAGPAQWRARVAQLAAKYDISPSLLEAVVWQESRWNSAAVSPVGARGLAQLMPGTARMMGVNPDDPHANLEGGARYLRQQLDAFGGDVIKALAAYNAGPGRVRAAGGVPSIRETQDYVAKILARLSAPVRN
jgi:soluble lytic murein transglycosylase-like protein